MKLFPVEFSELSDLLGRYMRSLKISKINNTINEKLAVERRVTRMMSRYDNDFRQSSIRKPKNIQSFRSPIPSISKKIQMKKISKKGQTKMFKSIVTPYRDVKNSICLSKDKVRTYEYSKSITSWLEKKMEVAKKQKNTPKLRISRAQNPLNQSNWRNDSKLNISKDTLNQNQKLSSFSPFSAENFELSIAMGHTKEDPLSEESAGEVKIMVNDSCRLNL
uniref:Uncharacterized protein n=1 Tax=Euplotes crassus TaxID=5936 RepID=A0A7S3KM20_EUPCR|mmetsp:Transcript_32522/g.31915  ORF Transcript_32522/g.31915 Transcript_32522/m.31915 type:complete len:220 (+) Transcript_32522:330-989(+)